MKFLKKLFKRKEKLTLHDFAYLMLYPATKWQRDDNFKGIIQNALKGNPDKTNRIYIELTAFQYWFQCFIIQVALKERENDWEIAVMTFREVWIRFLFIGDEIQVGGQLIKSEFPNMQISHKEYKQILRERTKDYDKAIKGEKHIEQVASLLCQNLCMGKDAKIILLLAISITSSIKYEVQALKELAEQFNLSLWEK
jgi:hypothetical protein